MSQENISYIEASSRYPAVKRSFAEVARELFSQPDTTHQLPSNSQSSLDHKSSNTSYIKTVYKSPRNHSPKTKGYDKLAHNNIVSSGSSSLGNGSVIHHTSRPSPVDHLIQSLFKIMDIHFSKHKNVSPDNVAHIASTLTSYFSKINGSHQNSSVEL